MRFHYTASQLSGKVIEGDFEAENTAQALEFLANQGLKPISLKTFKEAGTGARFNIFSQAITIEDKVFLTKYLSLMLKVGTDLLRAIDILINDFEKSALKALLIEVRLTLEKGQPFYSAFAKYPKIFPPVFVNLIKAGESSGNLDKIFSQLSTSLKKEQNLRHQIKSAVTYPIILFTASVIVLFLLVTFALPRIANVFSSSGFEPPAFSKFIFAVGIFMSNYMWLVLLVIIASIVGIWLLFARTLFGKKILYRFLAKIPIVGNVLKKIALQRFASTFSVLLGAGLPILEALEITANAVGNQEIKDSLMRISKEGISKGLTIGEAFRREAAFPRVVVNLMAISEKSGHIEEILATLSEFYESEIDTSIKSMVSVLEPLLLLGIGLVIGTIAVAIIIPIYQLVGKF